MEEIFSELLNQNKVIGVLYLSLEGKILFQKLHQPADRDLATINWLPFVQSVSQLQEVDLVFSGGRFYIRQVHGGFLVIPLENGAQASMIRLSCDLVMPALRQLEQKRKGPTVLGKLIRGYKS
jgi:hypothetical protein